ncbi:hypothetical protein IMAU10142_00615 [Lactobacillus helveticus]|nr:hypothetical protein [Lactobacillus helveticus]
MLHQCYWVECLVFFFGNKLSEDFKEKLNMIFGACSMGMGIFSIAPMK